MKRSYWKDHCKSCGEWLQGFDVYPECGEITKQFPTERKNAPILPIVEVLKQLYRHHNLD